MKQSRLKNLFYKRTHEHWVNYKRQRNHLVNTLVKIKKNYYTNLNMKDITDLNSGKQLNQILMIKFPILAKLYFQKRVYFE